MSINKPRNVAVIGAGIAGAACAHALNLAGHVVHVFDKSRGPGGRLATRRVDWVDRRGQAHTTRFDQGAVGITARSAAFQAFVDQVVPAGGLVEWAGGEHRRAPFDAAFLALPPARAASLPSPHRDDWARHASIAKRGALARRSSNAAHAQAAPTALHADQSIAT